MAFDAESRAKAMTLGALGVGIFLVVLLLWILTSWIISPDADEFYVLISRTGATLPPGRILAEADQAGIQKQLHVAGWAVYNPITWDYERHKAVTIPAGSMGILTALDGEELPKGQILAKVLERDPATNTIVRCQKGIIEDILMPGTYRLHPYWFKVEIKPAITIPSGQVGIITALTGEEPPSGQILAPKGQRGIQEKILEPGTHYLNPYAYKVDMVSAVQIPAGSVGIVTAQMGKPLPPGKLLAAEGERGVREKVLEPGLYFLNPYAVKVDVISLRSHRLDLLKETTHDDSIEFPSNDGFPILIDAAIEWRIKADKVAEVFSRLGDETQILDNVIRPNARSISRIEGSKYKATDFISGTNREKFELSFFTELCKVCDSKGVEIMRALVRKITVPDEISKPIREAEVARQEKLRNIEQIETQKSSAQLAKEKALVEQMTHQINAETTKIVRETEAQQKLAVAEIELKTAEREAQATVTRGKADADVVLAKKKAEAEGYKALIEAFGGGHNYAMYNFTQMVAQHTSFVFAPVGEGTFWTDPQAFFKMAGAKALQEKKAEANK
ncbi:MAG: hypothetical protein HYY16_14135 [Planctomycetes bacterium]|nr:hypothetical protein [Planctomycetota bacterium]